MLRNTTDREYLLSLGATPEQIDQFNADIKRALNIIEDSHPIQLNIATPIDITAEQSMQATGLFLSLRPSFESTTSQQSLIVNPERVTNNDSDLNGQTPWMPQYQSVPANQTMSSLQNMSVADLVASTELSVELMTRNIQENVRKETEALKDELQLALKTPTGPNHTAHTYLPTRPDINALNGNIMKSCSEKNTPKQ